MTISDDFLKCASECERMAKFICDPESKATWTQMAEQFHYYAETACMSSHDVSPAAFVTDC
jgi:hypothetical protein